MVSLGLDTSLWEGNGEGDVDYWLGKLVRSCWLVENYMSTFDKYLFARIVKFV